MINEVIQALNQYLPEQAKGEPSVASTTPRRLRRWLEQLPPMNVVNNGAQLYKYINEINRIDMRSRLRFELLDIIQPSILEVCEILEKEYLGQSLVLPERPRKIANLCQALQTQLAYGYLIVVRRAFSQISDGSIKRALPRVMQKAMLQLLHTLERAQLLYSDPPNGFWRILHQLYLAAEQYQLLETSVIDEVAAQSHTVLGLYKTALLLSVAESNQLRQPDIQLLMQAVELVSAEASLSPAPPAKEFFYVDLLSDDGPQHDKPSQITKQSGLRYLDVSAVLAALKDDKTMKNPRLRQHCLHAWVGVIERSSIRQNKTIPVDVAFGLSAMHYFITDQTSFDEFIGQDKGHFAGAETNQFLRSKSSTSDDVWGSINRFDSDGSIEFDTEGSPNLKAALDAYAKEQAGQDPNASLFPSYQCITRDVSDRGYGLIWQGSSPTQMKSGELVAVRETPEGEWRVGSIRWVAQKEEGKAEFGVQIISDHIEAVAARVVYPYKKEPWTRAVILTGVGSANNKVSILLPTTQYKINQQLEIQSSNNTQVMYLTDKIDVFAGVGHYLYGAQKVIKSAIEKTNDVFGLNDSEDLESMF